MRLLPGVGAGGECAPSHAKCVSLAKFITEECKNDFSTAYLLITPAVLHK